MPIDYSDYPPDWKQISYRIRYLRAKLRCECTGQCKYHNERCEAEHMKPHPVTGSYVILTTAHYPDPTKSNCAEDNLLAMCQRCHLGVDMKMHVYRRKYGHNEKQIEMDI